MPQDDGEERRICLGIGIHEEIGDQVWVVAGVVGENVRRQGAFGLRTILVSEDRRQGSIQLAPHGAQGIEPRTKIDRVDTDQGLRHLAFLRFPARTGGVVIGEGTRCREQAHVARFGRVESGPELRNQPGLVGLEEIPDHRQFAGRGAKETVLEILDLPVIRRQEGEAGLEPF
jgi:hypothetical protein